MAMKALRMCYNRCTTEAVAAVYVNAWLETKTKNELFEVLEANELWTCRIDRLKTTYRRLERWYPAGETRVKGAWRYVTLTMAEHKSRERQYERPRIQSGFFETRNTAQRFHAYLKYSPSMGIHLPLWSDKEYECDTDIGTDIESLNTRIMMHAICRKLEAAEQKAALVSRSRTPQIGHFVST